MRRLARIIVPALLVISLLIPLGYSCAPSTKGFLDEIKNWVVRNRQLPELSPIEYELMTTGELHSNLLDDFEAEYDERETSAQKELLELLGLIPENLDLYTLYLDLYTEQIAGYYDPEERKIYVISNKQGLSVSDKMTFAHEVTHALQDQHYDLETLLDLNEDNSEYSMSIRSLIEGDAQLTQSLYYWTGLSQRERDIFEQESEQTKSPIYDAAPRIIRESLIFPYTQGVEFVLAFYKDGGWEAVNKIYGNPPESLEQIIHPAKYTSGDSPKAVDLPDLHTLLGGSWKLKDDGTVGEFDLRLTLEVFIPPSETTKEAAAGWGGDKYAYLKDDTGSKLLVIYSEWDTEGDAKEFFDLYAANRAGTDINENTWALRVFVGKDQITWEAADLVTYLEISGNDVLLIITSDKITADLVRDAVLP